MARVGLEDSWTVRGDPEVIQDDLLEFVLDQYMTVVEESNGKIEAKQGSQFLTRFLGGWFVTSTWLPKRATVVIRKTTNGVTVRAKIEEALGLGVLHSRLKDKYKKHFERWIDALEDCLKEFER